MKTIILAVILSAVLNAGEPQKFASVTIAGKEYKDATITPVDHMKARVMHESGVVRVNIEDIPEDVSDLVIPKEKQVAEIPTETVHMRNVDPSTKQFQAIFEKVEEIENKDLVIRDVTVIQTIVGALKLARIGESFDVVMLAGDIKSRPDGEKFTALLRDTGNIQEYTTALGVSKRVKVMMAMPLMTFSSFIKDLKAGDGHIIEIGSGKITCPDCQGKPVPCVKCSNTGKITCPKTIEVVW